MSVLRTLATLGLVATLAGCGARTRTGDHSSRYDANLPDAAVLPIDADIDAFIPDAPGPDAWFVDGGDPCGVDRSPLTGMLCEESIVGRAVMPSRRGGCDEVIAHGEGILRWECNGRRAEASFPNGSYFGVRTGHTFTLCTSTQFVMDDACIWRSTQRIEGSLDHGELMLSYDETPVYDDGRCTMACSAHGAVGHP